VFISSNTKINHSFSCSSVIPTQSLVIPSISEESLKDEQGEGVSPPFGRRNGNVF